MNKKILIFAFLLVVLIGSAAAISSTNTLFLNGFGKGWIKGYTLYNVSYSGSLPSECLLTNSYVTMWNFSTSTCRTLNYTAIIGYTYPSLAGTGKALLCVDATGLIYRGNATGCP